MAMDMAALCIRLQANKEKEEAYRKSRSIKIMTIQEVKIADDRKFTTDMCQAINMSGSQCKSKSTCGKYCRRHKI